MHGRVATTERLTPGLVRVVLEGGDLADLVMPDATDAYVNVAFPPAGAPYGEVFDPRPSATTHPRPAAGRRRYTVRPGTRGPRCSPSTSWCTATRASPAPGPPPRARRRRSSSPARAAATAPTPRPTGT